MKNCATKVLTYTFQKSTKEGTFIGYCYCTEQGESTTVIQESGKKKNKRANTKKEKQKKIEIRYLESKNK